MQVEDILDDESDTEEEGQKNEKIEEQTETTERRNSSESNNSSSSSGESLTAEFPRGFKRAREKLEEELKDECNNGDNSEDEEQPSVKFRRGEQLASDLDIGQDSNSDGSVEAPDEVDDGEWNMMGAALEREFLSNN